MGSFSYSVFWYLNKWLALLTWEVQICSIINKVISGNLYVYLLGWPKSSVGSSHNLMEKFKVFGQPSISYENILLMFSSLFHLTGKSERFLYFLAMVDRQYSISSFFMLMILCNLCHVNILQFISLYICEANFSYKLQAILW